MKTFAANPDAAKTPFFTAAANLAVTFAAAPAADAPPKDGETGFKATLEGYAVVWGTQSDDRGGLKFIFAPNSVQIDNPYLALFHHDYAQPLATTANGTLRVTSDSHGLKVSMDLPDTTVGRDVFALVKRGDVRGMSFSMNKVSEYTENTEGDVTIVTITKCLSRECTVTAIPAFTATSIGVADPKADAPPGDSNYASALAADAVRLDQLRLALYTLPSDTGRNQ